MIRGKNDLSDVLMGAAGICLTIAGCAFLIAVAVICIAGTVKITQQMFAEPEETVIEETAE